MSKDNAATEKSDGGRDFSEARDRTDIELVVEGRSLHVSRHVMAEISPVFDKMFFGDYKEKYQKRVELPGKSYTSMLEFLRCVYPPSAMTVKNEHVLFLLPLANEYQVEVLLKKCLTVAFVMVKYGGFPVYKQNNRVVTLTTVENDHKFVMAFLLIAETHGFKDLKAACLEKSLYFKSTDVESTEEYKQLNDDVKVMLLRNRVQRMERDICRQCKRNMNC